MILKDIASLYDIDFSVHNITAIEFIYPITEVNDYLKAGRQKHLLHFLTDQNATRHYKLPDGTDFSAHPGDIIFAPEKSRYRSFLKSEEKTAKGICVCFDLTCSGGENIDFDCPPCVIGKVQSPKMRQCLSSIVKYCLLFPDDGFALKSLFFELLQSIRDIKPVLPADSPLLPAYDYIYSHMEENISISFLASICYQSESQFRRVFTKEIGMNPKDYLMNLRLRRAEQYASTTDLSISEIAEKLGFYDASALSHAYKKKTGKTLFSFTDPQK